MNELIKIENKSGIETANARDIYKTLEIKKDFSNWIKDQLTSFKENVDYVVYTRKGENLKGGRPSKEYYVSLKCAQHIALMSRTEKGREIRDYFIECENKLKSKDSISEDIKTMFMAFMSQQAEMNKTLMNLIIQKSDYKQIDQLKEKFTVKEYCQMNNISSYNYQSFVNSVGRLCSKMAKELNRSIDFVRENDFNVGKYDLDILKHSITIVKLEEEKNNTLFGDYK